ncbi:hypothetical protein Osc1_23810 [Hominimerdicola sp. 21CYCFAH17_S]
MVFVTQKIAALKTDFENCKQLYVVYADIAKTYNEISKGDYISRLAEEERRKNLHKGKCF